jgi:pimeloyl-ACP methyl ester carboxylesterase
MRAVQTVRGAGWVIAVLALLLFTGTSKGQVGAKKMTPAAPPPAQKGKGPKLPEPEDVALETNDGINIKATYYPGTAKKEAVPIIMVHDIDGQRGDFHGLALSLQTLGHASIVPDLRGHGQSKVQKRADGSTITLSADKLLKPDLEAMIRDVEACKKFLLAKNNAGECNIEQLCVVGAEFGSIIAVRWAAYDWSAPVLPNFKQGQDVKALVLLSPIASYKGITFREAMTSAAVSRELSMLIVAGTGDTKSAAEAKKVYNSLSALHPKVAEGDDKALEIKDLFLLQPETKLSGTKLLDPSLGVTRGIAKFIDLRLVKKKADFAWQERRSPLGK